MRGFLTPQDPNENTLIRTPGGDDIGAMIIVYAVAEFMIKAI